MMPPLAADKRHPADYRDDIEHAEVAAVLSELPHGHPACVAHATAAVSDSVTLTHLVRERPDLVKRLAARRAIAP